MKYTKEQITKLSKAVTTEALLKVAKEENIPMTEQDAEDFAKQFSSVMLNMEDLDQVTGGTCPNCPIFCPNVIQQGSANGKEDPYGDMIDSLTDGSSRNNIGLW
ncbi:MAG: hypothetical protein II960_05740 [Synergistaceae bacterium]|nr:hypothetical protein [Synergistaceae bacterium]